VSRRPERGVALLAATVALGAMSLLAVGLARTSLVDQRLTAHALEGLQADALVRSGVAVASVALFELGDAPDTLRTPWAAGSGRQPLGAGWVEVTLEDEARRLDLNRAPPDVLQALFRRLGLDPGLLDALADWTDADDVPRPHGAERGYYLGLAAPYLPANGPLATTGELALIRGFDAATVARLRPFVTVAGESGVNPNTAPADVLLALDPALAPLLTARETQVFAQPDDVAELAPGLSPRTLAYLTTRSRHYTARATAGVGDVVRAAEALLDAPGGADPQVVAWRPLTPP